MFAQRRNRLTTHFSERIPVVKRRISVHFRRRDTLLDESVIVWHFVLRNVIWPSSLPKF